ALYGVLGNRVNNAVGGWLVSVCYFAVLQSTRTGAAGRPGNSPPTSPVACPLRSRSRCATADTSVGQSLRNPSGLAARAALLDGTY
ncbi:hypothetical protein, partial [Streptomyces hydrogenans]